MTNREGQHMKLKTNLITLTILMSTLLVLLLPASFNVDKSNSQPLDFQEIAKDYQFNRFTLDEGSDSIKLENITKLYKYYSFSQDLQVKTAVLSEEEKQTHMSEGTGVSESIQELNSDIVEEKEDIEDVQEVDSDKLEEKDDKWEKKEKENKDWVTFEATSYTAKCEGCIGITRSGYDVRNTIYYEGMRVIAVDPKIIPLHSIVEVDTGEKVFTAIALDTGGDIKSYRIDILKETKEGALKFGRRDVKIKIKKIGGTK